MRQKFNAILFNLVARGLGPLTHSFSHLSLASVTMPCMRCSMRLLSDNSLCSCCCRVSSSCWSERLSCSYMLVVFCRMSTWRARQWKVAAKRKMRRKWREAKRKLHLVFQRFGFLLQPLQLRPLAGNDSVFLVHFVSLVIEEGLLGAHLTIQLLEHRLESIGWEFKQKFGPFSSTPLIY